MSFAPVRLNHAVLFVADLDRSLAFYTGTFGMEITAAEPRANAAFLRLPRSGNHHDLSWRVLGARPRALECSSHSSMSERTVAMLPVGSAVATSSRNASRICCG